MKTRAALAILIALTIVSCAKKDDNPSISRIGPVQAGGSITVNNNPNDPANCNGRTCGTITGDSQDEFQQNLNDFFGTDSSTLGEVSNIPGQSTGARFYSTVSTSVAIDCSGINNNNVAVNAAGTNFVLMVFDSFAVNGTIGNDGKQLRAIQYGFPNALEGLVNGDQVALTFSDSAGNVELDGYIDGQTFQGVVNFDGQSYQDALTFSIPVRAVFNCR